MVHSLEHLEGKIKNVQARKRKLACKNETLLDKNVRKKLSKIILFKSQ